MFTEVPLPPRLLAEPPGACLARFQSSRRRHGPEHPQPGDRGQGDMDPDDLRRELQSPLEAAHEALEGQEADHRAERPGGSAVAPWAPEEKPHADRGQAEDRGDRRVALDDPLQRRGSLEVEAVDELALVGAGMRSGGRRDRAGEDRQLTEWDQTPSR